MQEWYLLSQPSALGGFEDELLGEYGDSFDELLQSDIADQMILYKNDMSESWDIRGIVQSKIQDTKMQSLNRMVLLPIGTAKAGMYIEYKSRFWLIVNLMDDNHVYEKAIMTICNYQLSWVNQYGKIIQRWANITSAAQYNNGLDVGYNFVTRSDQLLIYMSDDFESLTLDNGKRFIIDKRCALYNGLSADEINKLNIKWVTYELARIDNVTFNYHDSGYAEYLIVQDELHDNDGYFEIDGKGYWLCDYSPTKNDDKNTLLLCWNIAKNSDNLIANINGQRFFAELFDENGEKLEEISDFSWEIDCDFKDELRIKTESNYIEIFAENSLIGRTFTLTLSGNVYRSDSIEVRIVGMI